MRSRAEKLDHWVGRTLEDLAKECDALRAEVGMPDPVLFALLDGIARAQPVEEMSCYQVYRMKVPRHPDCQGCEDVRTEINRQAREHGARVRDRQRSGSYASCS